MTQSMTMAEVARNIGVSRNVVSAVINGRAEKLHISAGTQRKIQDYLEKSGYVKSKHAIRLQNGNRIDAPGILTCGPFALFPHLTKALHIMSESIKNKYGHVDILSIDVKDIKHGLKEIVSQGIQRVIWIHATAPEYEMANAKVLMPLLKRMEKVVVYNYDFNRDEWEQEYLDNGIQLVGMDRAACYHKVAELFCSSGHSRVALDEIYTDHPVHKGPNIDKLLAPFEQMGFDIYGIKDSADPENTEKMTEHLVYLKKKYNVDCAFVRNDRRAGEIIGRLTEMGLRVPEDIAFVGFGNDPLGRWLSPPLTTFDIPVSAMTKKTLSLIREKHSTEAEYSYFANELIIRKSH